MKIAKCCHVLGIDAYLPERRSQGSEYGAKLSVALSLTWALTTQLRLSSKCSGSVTLQLHPFEQHNSEAYTDVKDQCINCVDVSVCMRVGTW